MWTEVAAAGIAAFCAGLAALWVFGRTRPASHVAIVDRTLPESPDRIWARMVAFDDHASWRAGLRGVRRVGDRLEETDRWGQVQAFRIVQEIPGQRLVTEVLDQRAFSGTWTCTLTPDAHGTRVEITERGTIHSVFLRALGALFFDPSATARTYLLQLARSFPSPTPPPPA